MIKKLIHYNYNTNFKKTKFVSYFNNKLLQNLLLFINDSLNKKQNKLIFNHVYLLKIKLKTKHLFLFTFYIFYNKLKNIINHSFFKFNINLKKQKRFTILRAPSNHKNSKEQYGITLYKGQFSINYPSLVNKFYHTFIIYFFKKQTTVGLNTLTYILKKNE